jgi:hypothetical protein
MGAGEQNISTETVNASILIAIGEMRGGQTAMVTQVTAMNNEIIRTRAEMDGKHAETQRAIADNNREVMTRMEHHRAEVNSKIDRINRYVWMAQGFAGLLSMIAFILSLMAALGWQPMATEGGYKYERPSSGPLAPKGD